MSEITEDDYLKTIKELQRTRDALTLMVEGLGGKITPPDYFKGEWYEWLIYESQRITRELTRTGPPI